MTKKSGTSTVPGRGRPATATATGTAPTARPTGAAPGAAVLVVLSLAWLAAFLWSSQRAIAANSGATALFSAAYALPGVISASLVSGTAMSLIVVNLLARRGVDRPWLRFGAAVGAGVLTGLLAALVITVSYRDGSVIKILAGTVAAAAIIGGAVGGFRAPVLGAGVTGALAVFAVDAGFSFFQHQLTSLYGAGETPGSQLNALTWFSRTVSVAGGLAAGLVVYGYLRWARRRDLARGCDQPAHRAATYLVAGATPGLILLVTEALVWTAGGRIVRLAGALSEADQAGQSWLNGSRLNHALIVLFVGAIVAMIAFGRSLGPAKRPADDEDAVAVSGSGRDRSNRATTARPTPARAGSSGSSSRGTSSGRGARADRDRVPQLADSDLDPELDWDGMSAADPISADRRAAAERDVTERDAAKPNTTER